MVNCRILFALFCILVIGTGFCPIKYVFAHHLAANVQIMPDGKVYLGPVLIPYTREEFGRALEALEFRHGAEIGVLRGKFTQQLLSTWPSCERFVLADPWLHQNNYIDEANLSQQEHEAAYMSAIQTLAPWRNITEVCCRRQSIFSSSEIWLGIVSSP